MNIKILRYIQLFWSYFIGIGALWGTFMMLFTPEILAYGDLSLLFFMQQSLPWPEIFFQSFTFPAICLLCANGLTNAVAIVMMHKRCRYAPVVAMCCGIILMLWITVQFVIFPANPLSRVYFIFGILQALNGLIWLLRERKTSI